MSRRRNPSRRLWWLLGGLAALGGGAAATWAIVRRRRKGHGMMMPLPVSFGVPEGEGEPVRVWGPPPEPPEPDADPGLGEVLSEGGVEIVRVDGFSCKRADKQPVPDIGAMMPAPLQAVSGPIGQAIVMGTDIVRQAFEQIGAKKVCTVRGGEFRPLTVVQRDGKARDFWVGIGVQFEGREEAAWWIYRGARSDTGVLPLQGGYPLAYQEGPKNTYLRVGDKPPGDLWPHVNIPRWRRSVPEALDQPFASVVRTGNDLQLGVWVPPRAPLSHLTVWGKRKIDAPVAWSVAWRIHAT